MNVSGQTLPTFNVAYIFSKVICFYFFQMYPDVAGDVQSITGECMHAWQRAYKIYCIKDKLYIGSTCVRV